MKKILILFGGNSYEYLISCKSAKTIIDNIDKNLYEVTNVGISKDNDWYIFNEDTNKLLDNTWINPNNKINNIIEFLKQFDKIFPIMHGNPVENGNLQGMLNLFNIPYVGSNLQSSIIGYDKDLTKIICNHFNIPQVPYQTIYKDTKIETINIEYPLIIKPAKCGSSIGINIANNKKELDKYLKEAFNYDNKVIIEKFINSRELECAILETDNNLIVAPVGEIKSANTFYDYEAKYEKDSTLIIPANIEANIIKEIQDLSLKIFKVLELTDLSRIDFLYDIDNHKLYFNEVNTMPGFTTISMYPMLFNNLNINITNLITKIIEN